MTDEPEKPVIKHLPTRFADGPHDDNEIPPGNQVARLMYPHRERFVWTKDDLSGIRIIKTATEAREEEEGRGR